MESRTRNITQSVADALDNATAYIRWFYPDAAESLKGVSKIQGSPLIFGQMFSWLTSGHKEALRQADALSQAMVDLGQDLVDLVADLALDNFGVSPLLLFSAAD